MFTLQTYTGLLHNFQELTEALGVNVAGKDEHARDAALIEAAYQAWGNDAFVRLDGQFSCVVYDAQSDTYVAARDRFGAEPLYYAETTDGRIVCATRISELLANPRVPRVLNESRVQYFLAFNYVPGEETLFEGITKVEPGTLMTWQGKAGAASKQVSRFWSLAFAPDTSKSLEEWARSVDEALTYGVATIGGGGTRTDTFLSGGVDSSFITAKVSGNKAFCVTYDNQKVSEEAQAAQTAATLGREFEAIKVTPEEFFANVDEFLRAYEQPSADVAGLVLYCAAKSMVQQNKSALCLSGEGADEFFAGYGVYSMARRLKWYPSPVYFGSTYVLNDREQSRFVRHYYKDQSTRAWMRQRCARQKGQDTLTWMLATEFRTYFEGSILFNSANIARGTNLDIRMPFITNRMLDVALHLPSVYKNDLRGHNKIALRKAASSVLPAEVAYRKKLGFPVPVRQWLADPAYNEPIRAAFTSSTADMFFNRGELDALWAAFTGSMPAVHALWYKSHAALLWRCVWSIFVFVRWYDLFFGDSGQGSLGSNA